jgi:hypothetical protein
MPDDVREAVGETEAKTITAERREACVVFNDGSLRVEDDSMDLLAIQRTLLTAALNITARITARAAQLERVLDRVYVAFDPETTRTMGALLGRVTPEPPALQEFPDGQPVP